jgi:hypothetical protein
VDPIVLRSAERIVAVLIGGVSIYLGYRLFLAMPERKEGEGKIALPGGISIFLTRVGPGAFFALFGAIIVAVSFQQAISYKETSSSRPSEVAQPASSDPTTSRDYTGFGSAGSAADTQLSRIQVGHDIELLDSTFPELSKNLTGTRRTDVEVLIPRLKLAMMKNVWGSDWGDYSRFQDWVQNGAAQPAPKDIDRPAAFYLHGRS